MNRDYRNWLKDQGYADNTIVSQLHRVQKVEQNYDNLDELLTNDKFDEMILELTYSMADERAERENPSKIEFSGVIRTNLASYKNAAIRYQQYWTETGSPRQSRRMEDNKNDTIAVIPTNSQKFALERDMQSALRLDIKGLDASLTIVDDGAEHAVSSGFIDILCEDEDGATVVIELKAGTTDSRVVTQILGYMGDLLTGDPERAVRGMIVAHDFDKRTRAAAHAVPNLELVTYSVIFHFQREQ